LRPHYLDDEGGINYRFDKNVREIEMSYHVKDYMRKDIVTLDTGASAFEASKKMAEKDVGYIIVLERGQPVGIVTERDLVMKIMAKEKDPLKTKIYECMSTPLITIDVDATVEEAVKTMATYGIRRLPVVHENIIYGVFTARDLAKHFSEYEDKVAKDIIWRMAVFSFPF